MWTRRTLSIFEFFWAAVGGVRGSSWPRGFNNKIIIPFFGVMNYILGKDFVKS